MAKKVRVKCESPKYWVWDWMVWGDDGIKIIKKKIKPQKKYINEIQNVSNVFYTPLDHCINHELYDVYTYWIPTY